ncbi:MAG: CHASE2 domain-containing protein [Leptolyngbyaceae cyanobacterium MO_188.B28]|nr:CHASE2 domain-containing protein [Leptolyngbyaceae cyanobacterium MO_188.B28]
MNLAYGVLLASIPQVKVLELDVQDDLMQLQPPVAQAKDIPLMHIDPMPDADSFAVGPGFYADLAGHLIKAGTGVVVLNFPSYWVEATDESDAAMQTLLSEPGNAKRIVLVARTNQVSSANPPELAFFNRFLCCDEQEAYFAPPEKMQGFFEYESAFRRPGILTSPARRIRLTGQFRGKDNPQEISRIQSFAVLAEQKFRDFLQAEGSDPMGNRSPLLEQSAYRINFFEADPPFETLSLESICFPLFDSCELLPSAAQELQRVRNKIVLIGFSEEQDYLYTTAVRLSSLQKIPAVVVQANLLANLMTDSFYRAPPEWVEGFILLTGGVLVSVLVVSSIGKSGRSLKQWGVVMGLAIAIGYGGLGAVFLGLRIAPPLVLPSLAWLMTGITLAVSLWIARLLLPEVQGSVERRAIILYARKLLHRIATDIHDGPLQEFKIVMDRIEFLQLDHPNLETQPIVERLEKIGLDLRNQLVDTRVIAKRLEVTPELRSGLDMGIRRKLDQWIQSGELTLEVTQTLQPLGEPFLDSEWIANREDIFNFFREAIANVMRHAQPPHGGATQVNVRLWREMSQCCLQVENDGFKSGLTPSKSGGYGTKLMETVASELPGGSWERVALAEGGIRVKLTWTLPSRLSNLTQRFPPLRSVLTHILKEQ